MPVEPKIIRNFPKCPWCGSEERVAELGCTESKKKGKIPQDAFASLRKEVIPIEQPLMAGVMVPCLVTHWDICGGCGRERCTRSEIQQAPIQMPPPGRGMPGSTGLMGGHN